jgi:hypothetical protein
VPIVAYPPRGINSDFSRLRAILGRILAKISVLLRFSQFFAFFKKIFGGGFWGAKYLFLPTITHEYPPQTHFNVI